MALTQLSDLVAMIHENYDTFNALSVQLSTELNALYQSGIVIPDPRLDEMAKVRVRPLTFRSSMIWVRTNPISTPTQSPIRQLR
jgi:hypothetical protein